MIPATATPHVAPDRPLTVSAAAIAAALADAGLLVEQRGSLPDHFTSISDDSRRVGPGTLFVAVRGSARDGHDFLSGAERAGAAAALVERADSTTLPAFVVRNGRSAAGIAAAAAYGHPAAGFHPAVGVTGTNGKSTTVGILRHLLDRAEAPSASIGTIGVLVGSVGAPLPGGSGLTTPGPIELQQLLRALADRGVRSLALEASSHSLDQHRIDGITFDAAVFTNLTRDHLDYHETMDAYFTAKARLLSYLRPGGVAVINADDIAWRRLPLSTRSVTFSATGAPADIRATDVRFGTRGSEWRLLADLDRTPRPVQLPLIGDFNVANAVGAAATAWALGMPLSDIAERLSTVPQVPGRLEVVHERPFVLRDYAHTPDALERALTAVRPFSPGRVIVVFGAGGDRDRGKRPEMGAIAERLADIAILTSDNPRTEDPERILDDIESGMRRPHERIEDREQAIIRAVALAGTSDLILLAGKGHETYQVRGTTHHPFDERAIVRTAFGVR